MEDMFDPNAPEVPENEENADTGTFREVTLEEMVELTEADDAPETENPRPDSGYRGAGTGRRESPFADSPYEMPPRTPAQSPEEERKKAPRAPRVRKKARGSLVKRVLAAVAAVMLVFGSCAVTAELVNDRWEDRMEKMQSSFNQQIQDLQRQVEQLKPENTGNSVSGTPMAAGSLSVSQVYAQNVSSVVMIESTIVSSYYGQSTTGTSSGSGFILSENGYVVTNFHVVEGASSVKVKLHDGSSHPAALVGYDSTNDVAVLKIEAKGLNPVELGSSSDLIVGDQVVAIGNPLGELTSTLTVGYVSAKERSVSTDGSIINMIQTDAAINSGNSGGPLFNMKGQVVGITTAKYSGASSSGATIEGIGFAVPMDDILDGIRQLIQYGYIKSAYLGVLVQNMDTTTADIYGLPVGAYVVSVEDGFCAQKAGMQAKDIIIAVGDMEVKNLTDLTKAMRSYEPGQVALVTVYRAGQVLTFQITLDERPASADNGATVPEAPETTPGGGKEWGDFPFFGD